MNNSQVAHIWANQSKPSAKGSNFYFEGTSLYSYGKHYLLGHLFNTKAGKIALINSNGYSSTTAKHTMYAVRALSGYAIMRVPKPEASEHDHADNIRHLVYQYEDAIKKLTTARVNIPYYIQEYLKYENEIYLYKKAFGIKEKTKLTRLSKARIEYFSEKARTIQERREKQEEQKRERQALAEKEGIAKWRLHENNQTFYHAGIALRLSIDRKEIETSRGAKVPAILGLLLYKKWASQQDITGDKIGHFQVDNVSPEYVKISCHDIPVTEINNFFKDITL